jgi:pantoate--beta-alanine ligase
MLVTDNIEQLRNAIKAAKTGGKTIGFVPTMGNLHPGHLSLVKLAQKRCNFVVCSIYVNPMQFGPNEDFDAYPRTLEIDLDQLQKQSVDMVFTPNDRVIYPTGRESQTYVSVPNITTILCGASRPGHFDGVTTVVAKLFNLVQPDVAIFGEKDYQQLQVIKQMVNDLNMPIEIIGAPIAREANGLARSSRNQYLSDAERLSAQALSESLLKIKSVVCLQQKSYREIEKAAIESLSKLGFSVDYLEIRHADGLALSELSDGVSKLIVLVAAFYGKPRLLDNLIFELEQA